MWLSESTDFVFDIVDYRSVIQCIGLAEGLEVSKYWPYPNYQYAAPRPKKNVLKFLIRLEKKKIKNRLFIKN